jgi:exonuclease SbcC
MEALEQKKLQLEQLENMLSRTQKDIHLWQAQLEQHRARADEYESLLSEGTDIEQGYSRYVQARNSKEELDFNFRTIAGLKERRHQLEKAISDKGQELIREYDRARYGLTELEQKSGKLPDLKKQLADAREQWRRLGEKEKELNEIKQRHTSVQQEVTRLEASLVNTEREIKETGEKLELLSTQTEATCPLCETELGAEGIERIASRYTADKEAKTELFQQSQKELDLKKQELAELGAGVSRVETELSKERADIQGSIQFLENEIAGAGKAEEQINALKDIIQDLEQRLASRIFAATEQQALADLERELSGIDYSPERHEEVKNSLNELERYDRLQQRLDEARKSIGAEKGSVARAEKAVQELQESFNDSSTRRDELSAEMESLSGVLEELPRLEMENKELTGRRNSIQEALWSAKAKLQRITEQEEKRKQKEKELGQSAREEGVYRELARAFGKSGVQQLIIETALPEIEAEANRLLGRMTDNRMHLNFQTQRETRKGGVIETLDINISDELGTRNYEMFSGGEAFRIDFAVRIALSRLLAKRAGTPLRTLIIDEGFGTQDSTGLEKLKEAIISIQDDFDRILVITHIEELRDSFPTRIEVTKTPDGSMITVN